MRVENPRRIPLSPGSQTLMAVLGMSVAAFALQTHRCFRECGFLAMIPVGNERAMASSSGSWPIAATQCQGGTEDPTVSQANGMASFFVCRSVFICAIVRKPLCSGLVDISPFTGFMDSPYGFLWREPFTWPKEFCLYTMA